MTTIYSLAAMAALNGPVIGNVFLAEKGKEGSWYWNSSDLSSKIANDPLRGVYNPPNSDTSGTGGAWVRDGINEGVFPEWFGGKNTAAIKAAYAFANSVAGSGTVLLKSGTTYTFDGSDRIVHAAGSCTIKAQGHGSAIIQFEENVAVNFIRYEGGRHYGIQDVKFVGPSTTVPTSGEVVQVVNPTTSDAIFSNIVMRGGRFWMCFDFLQANQILLDNIILYNAQHRHIQLRSCLNIFANTGIINGVDKTGVGIYLNATGTNGDSEAVHFSDFLVPNCSHSLLVEGQSLSFGAGRHFGHKFSQCWFDDAEFEGADLDYLISATFVSCDFVSAGGEAGCWLKNTSNVKFVNCGFFKNVKKGFRCDREAEFTFLDNCIAHDNDDLETEAPDKVGFWFESGAQHFYLTNCSARGRTVEYNKPQANGLEIGTNCDNFDVVGGVFAGNDSENIFNSAGNGPTKRITTSGAKFNGYGVPHDVSVNNDSAVAIAAPRTSGFIAITVNPDSATPAAGAAAILHYDVGSSLSILEIGGGSVVDVVSSNVTGTTGADGRVSYGLNTGEVKIENRLGGTAIFSYYFF